MQTTHRSMQLGQLEAPHDSQGGPPDQPGRRCARTPSEPGRPRQRGARHRAPDGAVRTPECCTRHASAAGRPLERLAAAVLGGGQQLALQVHRQRKRATRSTQAHAVRRQACGNARLSAHTNLEVGRAVRRSDERLGCTSGTAAQAASPTLCSSRTGQRQVEQPRVRCSSRRSSTRAPSS